MFPFPFGDASVVGKPFACLALVVFFVIGIAHFLRFLSTPRVFKGIAGGVVEGKTHIKVENTRKMSVFS
jgi:hypothetical protein